MPTPDPKEYEIGRLILNSGPLLARTIYTMILFITAANAEAVVSLL